MLSCMENADTSVQQFAEVMRKKEELKMAKNSGSFLPPVNLRIPDGVIEAQNISPNMQMGSRSHASLGERNSAFF